jgi:hypothetical protein
MLFIQASEDGKSAVEKFPSAKAVDDIDRLADRLLTAVGPGEHDELGLPPRGGIARMVRNLLDRLTAHR